MGKARVCVRCRIVGRPVLGGLEVCDGLAVSDTLGGCFHDWWFWSRARGLPGHLADALVPETLVLFDRWLQEEPWPAPSQSPNVGAR